MDSKANENLPEADFDEKDVGITEYLSEGHSLLARYKSRYTDFIVNEIGMDGQVVKPPPKRDPSKKVDKPKEEKKDQEPAKINLTPEQEGVFKEMLKDDDYKKLIRFFEELNLYKNYCSNHGKGLFIEVDCPEDKDVRKRFHETIRSISDNLDSETVNVGGGRKMLKVTAINDKNKRRRLDTRIYPDKYLQFTMMKTNLDSMGAIGVLGKFLSMRPNNFGIAGNKDKRGVTVQRVTLFRALAEDLDKLQDRRKWLDSVIMGDYTYVPRELKIGDLKGNRFALGLRLVGDYDQSQIENTLLDIKGLLEKGFINYYGLQRFGVTNIKTHVIGKEVLKKNWKSVIELILSADDFDQRADQAKKNFLKNHNVQEALKNLPHKNKLERSIIEGLKQGGLNNFKGAFMCIPRFVRELYGHAYQSYIWNKVVSRRINKYGKEPISGDMVMLGIDENGLEEAELEVEALPLENEDNVKNQEKDIKETKDEEKKDNTNQRDKFDPSKIVILTEETKGNYKLKDLIIPLVGREVLLPESNPITEIVKEVLHEDGLSLEDFIKSDLDIFFRGGFRKMITTPEDIQWCTIKQYLELKFLRDIVKYNSDDQDIQNPFYFTEKEPEGVSDGKFQAIRIKFNLPKSSYATMCVRELTKNSTSYSFQLKLNDMSNKGK